MRTTDTAVTRPVTAGARLARAAGRLAVPLVAVVVASSAAVAAVPGTAGASTAPRVGTPASVLQLGDSIGSGEGTLYGYTYNPVTRTWGGGNINATWPGPYPLCHTSPYAYGQVLSTAFGASFTQVACTGATFANGIVAPKTYQSTTYRPAEFGNWATQTDLNPDYDAAKPDLVLVSLGADDVQFTKIVAACVLDSTQCLPGNPGPTVENDFFAALPQLTANLTTLAGWITARGAADGLVPKVVFDDYMNPLPTGSNTCPDTLNLSVAQLAYLSGLLHQIDQLIISTVQGLGNPDIAAGNVAAALGGHEWCTSDPWDYGLSVLTSGPGQFASQAPFHPTPTGQQSLAASIAPTVAHLFGAPSGYVLAAADGGVFTFGGAGFHGSLPASGVTVSDIVGTATTPDAGGYWEVGADGGVFAFGDAGFAGSMGGTPLNKPVVGLARTGNGNGYWEVASDGGVFAFGNAGFYGSTGGQPLNAPIVGIVPTLDDRGYWEVASDGGVFAFGDAAFAGSMGGKPLNAPIVALAATPDNRGYWEVAADGGVFAFGDAAYAGSMGGKPLNAPIVGMTATADGGGYQMVASDGGIFTFGDAEYHGSMGGTPLIRPVVGMASVVASSPPIAPGAA